LNPGQLEINPDQRFRTGFEPRATTCKLNIWGPGHLIRWAHFLGFWGAQVSPLFPKPSTSMQIPEFDVV